MNAPFNPNNIPEQPLTPDYKDSLAPDPFTAVINICQVLENRKPEYGGLDASQWMDYLDVLWDDEQKALAYAALLRYQANVQKMPEYADELAEKSVEREYQRELI